MKSVVQNTRISQQATTSYPGRLSKMELSVSLGYINQAMRILFVKDTKLVGDL
jgi:hypothetical protein